MRTEAREVVVAVKEDLVEQNAVRFADSLRRVPFQRFDRIVLSLAGVRSIDASGIAVLVRLYSHLMSKKKDLVLTGINLPVMSLMRQIGLDEVMGHSMGVRAELPIPADLLPDSYMPIPQAQMYKH